MKNSQKAKSSIHISIREKLLIIMIAGILIMLILNACSEIEKQEIDPGAELDKSVMTLSESVDALNNSSRNPRTMEEGEIALVPSRDWTSGFHPGMLWMMYEYTGDEDFKQAADHYSMNIEQEKFNDGTHDMGFKMYCSFGNGYRLTRDPQYKDILMQSAKTLITRFNPKVGAIRSWDHNTDKWDYPVIIDNMMNLELLFWATRESRDSSYYNIALRHAETTLKNHFREDNSSYHVIDFDTLTGEVQKRNTHQGYSHESAWARGQAWGLYGFTMTYRETGDVRFLKKANEIAQYILNHPNLPADKVPYWDFDAPGQPDIPRDVSAAAIIASALSELSTYTTDNKEEYLQAVDQILTALSHDYAIETEEPVPFLLDHSTGGFPMDMEVDVPIIYADYYYLEALLRKMKLEGSWEGQKAGIIFKVDDLRYHPDNLVSPEWQRFADFMEAEKTPAAVGLICISLEKGNPDYYNWIVKRHESGLFEFWNHGYDHSRGVENNQPYFEFQNRSREDQQKHLKHSQELAKTHLGFDLVTFGAPYNKSEQTTADILEELNEIKVWLYPPNDIETSKIRLSRVPMMNIEYPVHNPSFYHFWNNYFFYSGREILVIQGHPNSWDERRFQEFTGIVNYINHLNLEVKLPRDLTTM